MRLKKKRRDLKVAVEMSVLSNLLLHESLGNPAIPLIKILVNTVNSLHKEGVMVIIGTDGRGKFGPSSEITQQVNLLVNGGLSTQNAERLLKNSR